MYLIHSLIILVAHLSLQPPPPPPPHTLPPLSPSGLQVPPHSHREPCAPHRQILQEGARPLLARLLSCRCQCSCALLLRGHRLGLRVLGCSLLRLLLPLLLIFPTSIFISSFLHSPLACKHTAFPWPFIVDTLLILLSTATALATSRLIHPPLNPRIRSHLWRRSASLPPLGSTCPPPPPPWSRKCASCVSQREWVN